MEDVASSLRAICEGAQRLLSSWEEVRETFEELLVHLTNDIHRLMPSEDVPEDFILSVAADLMKANLEIAEISKEELEQMKDPESVDVALHMFHRILQSETALIQRIRESLVHLIETEEDSRHFVEGSVAEALMPALEKNLAQLEQPYQQLEALTANNTAMLSKVRELAARELYAETSRIIPQDELDRAWQKLLSGETTMQALLQSGEWSDAQNQLMKNFVLKSALRLEIEISEMNKEELLHRNPTLEEFHGNSLDLNPFCLKLRYSDPVALGEEFTVALFVRNDSMEPQTIDYFQFEEAFLKDLEILNVEPSPTCVEREEEDGTTKISYAMAIQPGETVEYVLTLRAATLGNYCGEVTVWNGDLGSASAIPNIDVVQFQ